MATHSYRDLKVWQRAMDLVELSYAVVGRLPKEEKYALSDQIRRCAVSVPANIAEGQKRNSRKEFIQFCSIARGSLGELETHFEIAKRIYDVDIEVELLLCTEVGKMLTALVRSQEKI